MPDVVTRRLDGEKNGEIPEDVDDDDDDDGDDAGVSENRTERITRLHVQPPDVPKVRPRSSRR